MAEALTGPGQWVIMDRAPAEAPAAAVDVPTPHTTVIRFGPFDLDSKSGELRKNG
jgi:hypothetical protein